MSITKLRWDDDHDRCLGCGTRDQDRPHVAEGLCTDCFPARYGGFGLDDVRPRWAEPGVGLPPEPPPPPVPTTTPWHRTWAACLVCEGTAQRHYGHGVCARCRSRSQSNLRDGRGVVVIWLPFADGDPSRYSVEEARIWVTVADVATAWRYLERRAAAGQFPAGGKAVIRQTRDAARLPKRVIRRAA